MIKNLIDTGNGEQPLTSPTVSQQTAAHWLPLHQVHDNPYQPRQHYDAEHILNLALSIKQLKAELPATKGLQQVPLARLGNLSPNGEFDAVPRPFYHEPVRLRRLLSDPVAAVQIMFGHSRLRAWRVLNLGLAQFDPNLLINQVGPPPMTPRDYGIDIDLSSLDGWQITYAELMQPDPDYDRFPVTLGFALDMAMWQHAITENSQRKNINPIEEATAMARAQQEFALTDEQAGQPFGYARSTAANKMRLLKLPAAVQRDIAAGKLTERHGREFLRLADDQERLKKTYEYALKKGQTVAQLTETINWEAKMLKEEQDKQRELAVAQELLSAGWTPPGSSAPLPADRFADSYPAFFDNADDKRMLKSGLCGSQCDCCVLAYKSHFPDDIVRPDTERAPHIGLACAGDYEVRRAKQEALAALKLAGQVEASEAERQVAEARAQRKAKVEALNRQGSGRWERALATLDQAALWQDMRFWRLAAESIRYNFDDVTRRAGTIVELQQAILDRMYDGVRYYDRDLQDRVTDLAALNNLIAALTQPAGDETVSQETPDEEHTEESEA